MNEMKKATNSPRGRSRQKKHKQLFPNQALLNIQDKKDFFEACSNKQEKVIDTSSTFASTLQQQGSDNRAICSVQDLLLTCKSQMNAQPNNSDRSVQQQDMVADWIPLIVASVEKSLAATNGAFESIVGEQGKHLMDAYYELEHTDRKVRFWLEEGHPLKLENPQDAPPPEDEHVPGKRSDKTALYQFLESKLSTSPAMFIADHYESLLKHMVALAVCANDAASTLFLLSQDSASPLSTVSLYAMQLACLVGHVSVVDALVAEWGTPLQGPPYHPNQTPMLYAVLANQERMVEHLVHRHHANVNEYCCDTSAECNIDSVPALHHAAYYGLVDMTQCLLRCGADPNGLCQRFGATPLHYAAVSDNNKQVIPILVEAGTRVDATLLRTGETALHVAAAEGQSQIVQSLLQHAADPNIYSSNGNLPIHCACTNNDHMDVIRVLVDAGCSVDTCNAHGNTPLILALLHDSIHLVQALLEMGANVNVSNAIGPFLHKVLRKKEYGQVPIILDHGVDVNAKENDGETALHVLCCDQDAPVSVLRLLVDAGADVNARMTPDDSAPLVCAFFSGNVEIAEELIELGADLFIPTKKWSTPFHVAASFIPDIWDLQRFFQYWTKLVQNGDKERLNSMWLAMEDLRYAAKHTMLLACRFDAAGIVQMMLDEDFPIDKTLDSEGNTPLLAAVVSRSHDVVQMLLAAKANPNYTDNNGWTPLHTACQDDDIVTSSSLIANGASLNTLTNDGESALLISVKQSDLSLVKCLVDKGVDINGLCSPRFTVLHLACYVGNLEIARFLIDKGAETEIVSYEGYTPLQYACEQGHSEVASCLVKAGANMQAKLDDGRTALYMASSQNHLDVVKVLLQGGAKIDQRSFNGFTALHCSCFLGLLDLVELLLSNGANPQKKTPCGLSAIDIATAQGHERILELLLSWDLRAVQGQWNNLKTILTTTDIAIALTDHSVDTDGVHQRPAPAVTESDFAKSILLPTPAQPNFATKLGNR